MAWTYSDWVTYDAGTAKLTRLRLHIQEVSDYLQKNQEGNVGGQVYRRFDLEKYRESLETKEGKMADELGVSLPSVTNRARFTRLNALEP